MKTITDLELLIEKEGSTVIRTIGQLFVNAMNDRPEKNLISIDSYINILRKELGKNFDQIHHLNIIKTEPWILESNSSLIEIMNIRDEKINQMNLEERIYFMINYFKKK